MGLRKLMSGVGRWSAGVGRGAASLARKALSGPYNILRGIFPVIGGEPPVRGTRELLETYESMPWIRMIADRVSTSVASTEWMLLAVRDAKRDPEDPSVEADKLSVATMTEDGIRAAVAAALSGAARSAVARATGRLEWNGERAVRMPSLQRAQLASRVRSIAQLRDDGRLIDADPDHPFYAALDQPNPFMGRMGLMKVTELHLDIVGDAYWVKDRNALGKPAGYWPVPPHWVWEHPTPARPMYRIAYMNWQVYIPASEVRWFHEPTPSNPYTRGSGLGWSLGDELQVDEYAAKMAAALFFNRARPDFLVMGLESSEEELKRLKRDWENQLQGFWRAYKPHFITGKVDIKEFSQQHLGDQLMYPTLRKAQRDIVLQTWGSPPEVFGISEKGNLARTAYEAAEYLYDKYVVLPRVERIRQALQLEAQSEFDERIVVHYEPVVAADKQHIIAVRRAAPWAWDQDEWRSLGGDRPVKGGKGKVYMVGLNAYATTDLLDQTQRPQGAGVLRREDDQKDKGDKENGEKDDKEEGGGDEAS